MGYRDLLRKTGNIGRIVSRMTLAAFVLWCTAPEARAMSMDKTSSMKDYCQSFLGADAVQMWGYLPDAPNHQYCGEIPVVGPAILTFDLFTSVLRETPIEVRIVRASLGPIDDNDNLAPITVAHLDAKTYPGGVITLSHNFEESGLYIALVTSIDPTTGERKTARFSFSVGRGLLTWLPALLAAIFLAGAVAVYWRHSGPRAKT